MKHWKWEKDRQDLAWLTFDKLNESANTFSREALQELDAVLEEIRLTNPKGLVIRSAKDSFIAGADVEEFTRLRGFVATSVQPWAGVSLLLRSILMVCVCPAPPVAPHFMTLPGTYMTAVPPCQLLGLQVG